MDRVHASGVDEFHLLPNLKHLDRWVPWRAEQEGTHTRKVPVNVDSRTGDSYRVSYRDPDNLYTYHRAADLVDTYDSVDGLQVVVDDSKDDFVIVDFDDCVDPETGRVDDAALPYLERSDTYAELSPSGTGFHLVFRGTIPRQGWTAEDDAVDAEAYDKYVITVTERHLVGSSYAARRNDELLENIFADNDIRWRERLFDAPESEDQLRQPAVSD